MRETPKDFTKARLADVHAAVGGGHGFRWLGKRWRISKVGAYSWCSDNVRDDDFRKLGENGRLGNKRNPNLDTFARLELVELCTDNGWTQERMAHAMGMSPSNLSVWLSTHAPFGLVEALGDFREAEAA